MKNKIPFLNKYIIIPAIIIVVYYYRSCIRMIQNVDTDHVNMILHITMLLLLLFGAFSWRSKSINKSSLSRNVIVWIVVISIGGLINWRGVGSIINPLLWCVYYLVFFLFFYTENDEKIIKISLTVVCFITLIAGYMSMDIATIINQTSAITEEYDTFLNIIGFTVTTIPTVMTLKNKPIKWFIYFGMAVVAIVTGRRMALGCVAMVVFLSFLEFKEKKKTRWVAIVSLLVVIYFAYLFVVSRLYGNLEMAMDRMTTDDIANTEGSGRFVIWKDVWEGLLNSSVFDLIFGHGTYGVLSVTHHTAAHNDALEYIFDYGIIGFFLLLFLHIHLIKRMVFLFREKSNYRFSYFMSYFVFVLYGTFGNVLMYPQFCLPLVSFWGYMEAIIINTTEVRHEIS